MTTTTTVSGALLSPGPCVARITWSDESGQVLGSRRSRDLTYALHLAPGRYVLEVEDERASHDPRRLAGSRTVVDVPAGRDVEQPLHLTRTAPVRGTVTVDGAPARHARVHVRHTDGTHLALRTGADGGFLVAGLPAGEVRVTAYDARRTVCAPTVVVGADRTPLDLPLDTATTGIALRLRLPDGLAVPSATGRVVDLRTGESRDLGVVDGVASVHGLAPGSYDLELEPSVGILGGIFALGHLDGPDLRVADVVVERSAVITGRVLDESTGLGLLAAPVCLYDAEGVLVERTRTDRLGRFVLGTDLRTADELTVVVSGGPERRHVQPLAVADVAVRTGRRQDLGALVLPRSCTAHWWPRTHVTLTQPATHV